MSQQPPAALSPGRLVSKLETIARQVGRLDRLVNSLLDLARIISHRLPIEREDVDLAEVVRDVAARSTQDLAQERVDESLERAPG